MRHKGGNIKGNKEQATNVNTTRSRTEETEIGGEDRQPGRPKMDGKERPGVTAEGRAEVRGYRANQTLKPSMNRSVRYSGERK